VSTAVVVLAGPPGSGKSTLLERLEERLRKGLREGSAADGPGVRGVETGDLLRRESERDSELGRQVRPYLERGKLAPTALVEQVVARVLEDSSAPVALFDGFPRNAEEVESLERLEEGGRLRLAAVLVLHLTRETALERISGRRRGRDDRPEVVERRLDVYERETLPAIEILQARRQELVHNLSAEPELEAVVQSATEALEQAGLSPGRPG